MDLNVRGHLVCFPAIYELAKACVGTHVFTGLIVKKQMRFSLCVSCGSLYWGYEIHIAFFTLLPNVRWGLLKASSPR